MKFPLFNMNLFIEDLKKKKHTLVGYTDSEENCQ